MAEMISARGTSFCRVCKAVDLHTVLDLGEQPLPAEYGLHQDEVMEAFPLHLRICSSCGLGQLGEFVMPERIFHKTYPYLSSASSTWLQHAHAYAAAAKAEYQLNRETLVLELASNDGYLLKAFRDIDVSVLGIEPAANVATMALNLGVPTLIEFFGREVAERVVASHGYPRLIVANNVFAHIPDMHDFMGGIAVASNDETVISIENPSFTLLLQNTLFDTIYHEHYSYLSAHAVRDVARAHGLDLFRVERLSTHGGSNRYWLSKSREADESVFEVLQDEREAGLFDPEVWAAFAARSLEAVEGLRLWLRQRQEAGDIVVGYGAAHKGNTFLNAVGDAARSIRYVVDASVEKQGKFLPGSQIPVLAPSELTSGAPTDVLILPWNIASEICKIVKEALPQARVWVAQPSLRRL